MSLVVSGLLNKQVGAELGISEITVKAHRGNVMRKMQANSLADLVNMAARLHVATVRNADAPTAGRWPVTVRGKTSVVQNRLSRPTVCA
jgi:hypothetical protein